MDIEIKKNNNYLEVIVSGSFDLNDALHIFPHVLEKCSHERLDRILIDFRELVENESATLKSFYAFGVEEHYLKYLNEGGNKLQFAYLAPVLETFEPGLEIADQKKLPAKLFDNLEDAILWLDVK